MNGLKRADLLSALDTETAAKVTTENSEGALKAVRTADGSLYAYPMSLNNGYFLYYDKSVISEANAKSVEGILLDCGNAQKYFAFDTNSAFYLASWFFGAGCVSEWTKDETGTFVAVNDDFNSAKGLIAARGLYDFLHSDWSISMSSASGFEENNCAALVSGIWDYDTMKELLGDNLGVTDLPSYMVDLEYYHLGSFGGSEAMGVRPQTDPEKEAALHKLALYLTSEQCQMERYEMLGISPSNLAAQASPEVQENEALAALLKQSRYSVPQGEIHGSWWSIGQLLGQDISNCNGSIEALTTALNNYRSALDDLFSDPETARAFTVIGEINGTHWDTDFPMTEESDGVWVSEPLYLQEGAEFKCRKGLSWEVSYGKDGENYIVEETGTYRIRLTLTGNDGVIDLIPVNALRVGFTSAFQGCFSPFFYRTGDDHEVVAMTQLNLLTLDRQGGIVYNAAQGETVSYNGTDYLYTGPADVSVYYDDRADRTTYTATLRPGIKFSDGVEVTADDLIFTYYTLCDPSYDGQTVLDSYNILWL